MAYFFLSREFYRELSRKAVYPVHKMDINTYCAANRMDITCDTGTGEEDNLLDYCINPHYLDMPRQHQAEKKLGWKCLSKPNEIQKHTLGVCQDHYIIWDNKWDALTKLGIYEPGKIE